MSDIGDLLAEISAMQRESDRPAEGLRGVPWQEENQRTHGTPSGIGGARVIATISRASGTIFTVSD
jgi:hypothetical protein